MSYLLHVSILLAGLYLFYWLLLRRETFFQLNRWLLIGSLILAIGLPLLRVPAQWSLRTAPPTIATSDLESTMRLESPEGATLSLPVEGLEEALRNKATEKSAVSARISAWGLPEWILIVYLLGASVFAGAFLLQLIVVLRKRSGLAAIQDGRFTIYELEDDTPPFSFGKWIFLNPTKYNPDTYHQILEHEKLHVAQAHTLDKVLAEMVVILLWFNPFAWMMRTAITKNLEYLTDAEMLDAGTDATSYQMSLVQVSVPQYALSFSTNYNESFLKSRVIMMNAKKSSASSSWKYLLLLPVLLLSVLSLNATQIETPDGGSSSEVVTAEPAPAPDVKGIPAGVEGAEDDLEEGEREWDKIHRETITREFAAGKNMALDVHNVTGKIDVQGYAGDKIKVTVEKVIKATSESELQRGKKEVQLGVIEDPNHLYLYHDSPYTEFNPGTEHFQIDACAGGNCYNYQFYLHYQIMVPFSTNLMLSTINGGDILVQKIESEYIEARHISGSVYMKEVAGVREVYTISGHIEVEFTKNPTTTTSFVSTSGHVTLDLMDDFGGEVSFSSLSGKLHSSFPVDGKRINEGLGSAASPVSVGSGGERMELRSISGNLTLK